MRTFCAERRIVRFAAALLIGTAMTSVVAVPAHAQESNASLRGKITADGKSGASQVVAIDLDSGYRRTVEVRADGSYNFASLRPGRYKLEITTASGTRTTDEITLLVAQNAVLNFDFSATEEVAGEEDSIVVTAGKIQTMQAGEIGANITERLIDQLPQTNRNFLAFADLAPGVAFITDGSGNSRLQGGAQGSNSVNVFIDGVGQKDYVLKNGITGQDSTQGNPFPQMAIGEYRVISSNYKAEFDQVSSAAITAVTKSGTNEFHGEVFVDYSDQSLRAKRPTEIFGNIPKVKTQDMQFGGALGGPIIKDLAHFFVAYEGKRIQQPVDITPGGGRTVTSFPTQYQSYFGSTNRDFNEDLYFGKIDIVPSEKDLIEVSLKYRDETGENLNSGQLAESTATLIDTEELRGLLRYERTEDTWVNDFKVTYEDAKWAPTPRVFENGSLFQGNAAQNTLLQIGGSANYQNKGQKGWGIQNDFTYTGVDDHALKIGVKAKWVKLSSLQLNNTNPIYTYNADYGTSGFNDTIPWRVQFGAQSGPGNPVVKSDNFQFGIYAQDDWDVTDRLTLNVGIRWDYEETPSFLDYVTPPDAVNAVSPANYPNLNNADYDIRDFISTGKERKAFKGAWQPRLGFSYKLDEDGRFTIFGGAGRSYDRTQFDFLQQEISQGAFTTRTFQFFVPGALDPLHGCAAGPTCLAWDPVYLTEAGRQQLLARVSSNGGGRELRFINNDLKMPYSDQFSLGFRGRFADLMEAEVGISHVESKDGFVYLLGNRRPDGSFFPPNATPSSPFGFAPPGFGSIIIGTNGIETSADSAYFKFTKTYTPVSPWSLDATYTYTEAEANRKFNEVFSLDYPSIDDYPVIRSSGVRKHRFVMAGSADLPWGFIFSGKLTLASAPYVQGFINETSAPFQRLIKAIEAENGIRQIDVAFTKYIPTTFLSDESRVKLRVDIINLFNDRNYVNFNENAADNTRTAASPTIFGERTDYGTGGNLPRTIKLTAGFSF
ncbi:TonB-dependent receptor domain-containing protein [Sphingomonas sp. LaA6.9]|uniref:TonB-dependent receptor domain-containing protein n=1 Tax=Sphingomonas sp. LaA6.9 TaxID=2919914 RepID=UPI001F4F4CA8|nr:TonB-dependent receptor [Sphingomonas sp. LaA6.9]MCJ8156436.1 TonB-dependent receptor [Sphingomonas sp. LaA6.9]